MVDGKASVAITKEMKADLFGASDQEPNITEYLHATVVIHDGRGGCCRFDKTEVNDLVAQLSGMLPNDAPKVKVIDLTNVTSQ